ncbi:hypothetical protein [Pantoea anthophila]|uniref:hypothetical protein n=1 Tax=Pantoea anthophila TaxID=470931 RepID=UPI002DB737FF|nr:hypothetical protein [Pantoea anthophila]MEB5704268.1 hypothetical protein [Pantoea anthophila]MEB6515141.1 hypothetical protein [Pantoea anthophila]
MQFLSWLVGRHITELLQQGRELDQAIARQDNSILARSTPELERYFKQPSESLPRQNGFPIAIVLMLLLVAFAFNLLTFLHALPPLTPQIHALSFFGPSILVIGTLLAASYRLARGHTSAVAGLTYVWAILLVSTVLLLSYGVVTGSHSGLWLLLALAALWGARWILNGQAFILFAIYCRTQRLASVARQRRMK